MLGRGALVAHVSNTPSRRNIAPANFPHNPPSSQIPDDETSSMTNSQSKINPSEIPAEELTITCSGTAGSFTVTRGLTAKIYFQKKHFLWEFSDSSDSGDKRRKRKIEIKFQDIRRMYVVAKDGAQGRIVIETHIPLTLYKEKSQPVKSTQWEKASDFTGGFCNPREGSSLMITTVFAKDVMSKRVGGKASHLDKLLSSDPRLKKLIENDTNTSHDAVRDILSEQLVNGEEHTADLGGSLYLADSTNPTFPPEVISQFSGMSGQELLETCIKTLKLKKLPSASLSKYRFRCPACKSGFKCGSEGALREHLYQRHKHLVDLGLSVAENGNFVVPPGFLVNVLAFERVNSQQVKQIVKSISYLE